MHFGPKREPDRGTMMGLLDNRKSEIDFVQVGFNVDYKIFDKRIIKG